MYQIKPIAQTTFSKSSISEENVIEKTKRQSPSKTIVTQIDSSDDDFQLSQDSSDDEWELLLCKKREIVREPADVTLTFPAKTIPTISQRHVRQLRRAAHTK